MAFDWQKFAIENLFPTIFDLHSLIVKSIFQSPHIQFESAAKESVQQFLSSENSKTKQPMCNLFLQDFVCSTEEQIKWVFDDI